MMDKSLTVTVKLGDKTYGAEFNVHRNIEQSLRMWFARLLLHIETVGASGSDNAIHRHEIAATERS